MNLRLVADFNWIIRDNTLINYLIIKNQLVNDININHDSNKIEFERINFYFFSTSVDITKLLIRDR